jgi:hypothetical protein
MENYVVNLANVAYKNGPGYDGYILRVLQFPEGPYTLKVANIFVNQAKTVDSKVKFKVQPYSA